MRGIRFFKYLIAPLSLSALVIADEESAIDAKLIWTREIAETPYSSPIVSDGVVYVGSGNGSFYAIDLETQDTLWEIETGGAIHATPLVTETALYFESDDRSLYKVNREDGEIVWTFGISGEQPVRDPNIYFHHVTSTPVLSDGRLYFGSGNRIFYCLNDEDASVNWTFEAHGRIRSKAIVTDRSVLVASFGPNLYGLEKSTGNPIWRRDLSMSMGEPFWSKVLPSPVLYRDRAIIGFRNGNLQAFDSDTGETKWTATYPNFWVEATGLVIEDRLYIGSSDAAVARCYNALSGDILWETNLEARSYGQPPRFENWLFFGLSGAAPNNADFRSGMVALDLADGSIDWRFELEKPTDKETFRAYGVLGEASIDDGILCFSDETGALYAFALEKTSATPRLASQTTAP